MACGLYCVGIYVLNDCARTSNSIGKFSLRYDSDSVTSPNSNANMKQLAKPKRDLSVNKPR